MGWQYALIHTHTRTHLEICEMIFTRLQCWYCSTVLRDICLAYFRQCVGECNATSADTYYFSSPSMHERLEASPVFVGFLHEALQRRE